MNRDERFEAVLRDARLGVRRALDEARARAAGGDEGERRPGRAEMGGIRAMPPTWGDPARPRGDASDTPAADRR
jgi:hypothetical protein